MDAIDMVVQNDTAFWDLMVVKERPVVMRTCLKCGKKFKSSNYRMCARCQNQVAKLGVMAGEHAL